MASAGQRIAAVALAHAGCSAILDQDKYDDVIVRPADRNTHTLPYYNNNPKLSTCALFACGVLRLAGCTEPECVGTYFPAGGMRNAMADIQTLAHRFDAWTTSSSPVPPFKAGDVWIIADLQGMDAHTGVCTGDAVVNADGSWTVSTVEGGQVPVNGSGVMVSGSTAIAAFSRRWKYVGNRWMLGARYLLGYASAEKLPIPDDQAPASGDPAAITSDPAASA